MYKTYCDEGKNSISFSQRIFKEELKNYFRDYKDDFQLDDGLEFVVITAVSERKISKKEKTVNKEESELRFDSKKSIFDKECAIVCSVCYRKRNPFDEKVG